MKRFERSNGLDTALYKNYFFFGLFWNIFSEWHIFLLSVSTTLQNIGLCLVCCSIVTNPAECIATLQ